MWKRTRFHSRYTALRWIGAAVVGIVLSSLAQLCFRQPIREPAALLTSLDPVCATYLSGILYEGPDPFSSGPVDDRFFEVRVPNTQLLAKRLLGTAHPNGCRLEKISPVLGALDASFKKVCGILTQWPPEELESNAARGASYDCFRSWMKMRYEIARQFTKPSSGGEIRVLESRLFPALFNEPESDLSDLASACEQLCGVYRDEAKRIVAAKCAVQSRYLQWVQKSTGSPGKAVALDNLEHSLDRVRLLAHEDPFIDEIELSVLAQVGEPIALHDRALAVKKARTQNNTGDYYLAWAGFLIGDVKRAGWHLAQILRDSPSDIRAFYTAQHLQTPDEAKASGSPVFLDLAAQFPGILFTFKEDRNP